MKATRANWVIAGLLLGILMAAMDNTIVSTAMATIVDDLGGLDKFVWVTSAYMVATMAGMPIFGKLSDMYGRKRFFILGIVLFMIGSALCGLATSIEQLSIFRAIQGIGGGALMPIAFTILFDVFPPEKRGSMTALFGATFGLSSVMGPLLGAYITESISWHWVFYINIPFGILSLLFVAFFYKESPVHNKQSIDWLGAITLVVSVVSLMFALELGGKEYAWDSKQIIGLFSTFGLFIILFIFAERKAKDPIIPFFLFKKRLFAMSQSIAFLYGAAFILGAVYIPIYIQGVFGGSATNAGILLMPMMIGTVIGSSGGGGFVSKTSYRNLMIISCAFLFSGIYLLSTLTVDTSRTLLTIYMLLTGIGAGFSFSLLNMSSIHNLDANYRGVANSSNAFFRSLGMTIGISIFGTLQNNLFTDKLKEAFKGMQAPSFSSGNPQSFFSEAARNSMPPAVLEKITDALSYSISNIFFFALIPVVISFVCILFMGKERLVIEKKNK